MLHKSLDVEIKSWEDILKDKDKFLSNVLWRKTAAFDEIQSGDEIYTVVGSSIYKDKDGERVLSSGANVDEVLNNPKTLLWNHSWWEGKHFPLGAITEVGVSDKFLFIKFMFDKEDEFAMKVKAKLDRGYFKFSIGFTVAESDWDYEGRVIKSYNLLELSIVIIPSNNFTGVLDIEKVKAYYAFTKDFQLNNPNNRDLYITKTINQAKKILDSLNDYNKEFISLIDYQKAENKEIDLVDAYKKSFKKDTENLYLFFTNNIKLFLHHFEEDEKLYTNKKLLNEALKDLLLDKNIDLVNKALGYMHLKYHYKDLGLEIIDFSNNYNEEDINKLYLGVDKNLEKPYIEATKETLDKLDNKMSIINSKLGDLLDKIEKIDVDISINKSNKKQLEMDKKFYNLIK